MTKQASVAAPAKINLTLHVTGQRADGYHQLDSLVAFATVHDALAVRLSEDIDTLTIEGPEAKAVPADRSNLCAMAALALDQPCHITLHKNLPTAAGVGGGSADAAAVVRAIVLLREQWQEISAMQLKSGLAPHAEALLALGADIPMCLMSRPVRVRGIGDELEKLTLPETPVVLANPRRHLATTDVFSALIDKRNPPMRAQMPVMRSARDLIEFLAEQRNDLEAPAERLQPVIKRVLSELRLQTGCGLARMSGSGATCFGLFEDEAHARAAARALRLANPDWWVAGGYVGDQLGIALPQRVDT